ncbi:homocysteine S-methyltransferase family protein [Clostridium botulinum]|uniref:Methionine synthase n=1 Tax=Clostridium botulinum TaxID=1491 RepID=A0A9Q1V114_CLOBO|nr:homocysteine S-methyltransferase family protein [Clostridium botulinum]AEB76662.1 5-methyltetrahydrofolate--homocysteine methyltransferase, putative [Clostridium botulinum BKT015925]KLU76902.1 homocysteine methyltransferase [Clostridium botulinum V891]KOA73078.1 homocysteine methyltransferase [Clostridium botulinum]KOA79358.1 homocysteine methyltransferase [Clostridium botulinum]KOA85574.1 homocysteine methyltransferase [Clostridium botulinum]
MIDINKFLLKKHIFFDGAMGTMLQNRGISLGEVPPEIYNILNPKVIKDIHKKYIDAGVDIITTNTFGANELKLKDSGYSVEKVIEAGVKLAKEVSNGKLVALDIGPTGEMLEPMGDLKFERAYEIFKSQVIAGVNAGCDIILIETISDLYEAKAAILAAKENSSLPVFCTMTFGEDGRTFTGTDPITMVSVLEGLSVDALGINCSLGPKEMLPVMEKIIKYSSIPVIAQPNAGLPRVVDGKTIFDITPEEFAFYQKQMASLGVSILGGCCGTTDKYIKVVIDELKNSIPKKILKKDKTMISSYCKTVILGEGIKVVGERINPTGKEEFKEAIKSNNISYILNEAISQRACGAHILDINVGLPGIDEKDIMVKTIKNLQSTVDIPLQIDSADCDVIEAATRIYNGKPIINSVNGKQESMKNIFPIVKKYGACVIALTLDENGIPTTIEDRVKIAEKIINTAKEYGIDKKDIIVDCLVLTASAQQKEVMETLDALGIIKEKFKVKTILGISNISFGLPKRELMNRTFLTMALTKGLDVPILNPNDRDIMETIKSFEVLANIDTNCENYIGEISNLKKEVKYNNKKINLKDIVVNGVLDEVENVTKELLKTKDGVEIIEKYLIPALDLVGNDYEEGKIFLPQLIKCGETVKKSFQIIKDNIKKYNKKDVVKGKIVLATVKDDIHDIGKNIVKLLLENYGFEVVDLGKNVSVETILEVVKKYNIKLVGLSALMTTTVKSMEETISRLKEVNPICKVFVGGAVLNEEYAKQIGADYYAKDARESVLIANEIFK